jgi:hypothetical protein
MLRVVNWFVGFEIDECLNAVDGRLVRNGLGRGRVDVLCERSLGACVME